MKKTDTHKLYIILIAMAIVALGCFLAFKNITVIQNFYMSLSEFFSHHTLFPLYIRVGVLLLSIVVIYILYRTSQKLKTEINYRKQAQSETLEKEERLEKSLALSKATLEATADGILVVDRDRRIVGHNEMLAKMWNVPSKVLRPGNDEEAVGYVMQQLKDPAAFIKSLERLYNAEPTAEHLDELEFKNGKIFERYTKPQMHGAEVIGRVFSFRDVTQRKKMEEQLTYQATHDSLTLLPNRIILLDRINQCISRMKRSKEMGAVLFFDLDRFKLVNDSLGHDMGDILLQSVARRLEGCVRENDTVARLGGDEFVILLTSLEEEKNAVVIATKCLVALEEPFVIDKHTLAITSSVGISFLPRDGKTPIELLKNADSAMYYAKAEGRNNYKVYAKKMNAHTQRQLELTNELHEAVKNNSLQLYYQPLINLKDFSVVSVEALLRWNHPKLGQISPAEFIPIAEDTGLILLIGEWVLRTACLQTKAWQDEGLPKIKMAINLSGQQFRQRNIPDLLRKILKETALDPQYLDLELTESVIMENTLEFLKCMHELKSIGINLVIDDFGTGYSSLSYLKRFPVDTLKIDISFVRGLPESNDDAAIIRAIIAMAKQLKLDVVAEGIETKEQLSFLKENSCNTGQGFIFSKAIPAKELSNLLKENNFKDLYKTQKKKHNRIIKERVLLPLELS